VGIRYHYGYQWYHWVSKRLWQLLMCGAETINDEKLVKRMRISLYIYIYKSIYQCVRTDALPKLWCGKDTKNG